MNSRALTLAIRLLSTAAAGVALGSMTACPFFFGCGDDTGWQDPVIVEVGVTVDLLGVAALSDYTDTRSWSAIAVGVGGTAVVWGQDYVNGTSEPFHEVFQIGDASLRGALGSESEWWVVGDAGTLALSMDRGQQWMMVDPGTTASLRAIVRHGTTLVAAGDGVIVVAGTDGVWSALPAPTGDWGQLRALYSDGTTLWAVGLGGVVWSSADLSTWTQVNVGVTVDLFGVASNTSGGNIMIVGAAGTLLVGDALSWTKVETMLSNDLIDCEESGLLADDGKVYTLDSANGLELVAESAGALALQHGSHSLVRTVGDGGVVMERDYFECIGGRPFAVDGELHTAALAVDAAWCEDVAAAQVSDALAHTLAAAWARDGLYEHASVASFARFGLELLALGAPARLLADVQRAGVDELEHARLCFALARSYGGVAFAPGPMPLPRDAFARVGDAAQTALALFEEGCLNESVAACEAAEAAAGCEDPRVRAVLERIAADERRHATAAWAALRWLIDAHGEQVLGPLRERVRTLGAAGLPGRDAGDEAEDELARHGRLSPRRRAEVSREVVAAFVRPLARAMVSDTRI